MVVPFVVNVVVFWISDNFLMQKPKVTPNSPDMSASNGHTVENNKSTDDNEEEEEEADEAENSGQEGDEQEEVANADEKQLLTHRTKASKEQGSDEEPETEVISSSVSSSGKNYSSTRVMFHQPTAAREATAVAATTEQGSASDSLTANSMPVPVEDGAHDMVEAEDEETAPDDPRHLVS